MTERACFVIPLPLICTATESTGQYKGSICAHGEGEQYQNPYWLMAIIQGKSKDTCHLSLRLSNGAT